MMFDIANVFALLKDGEGYPLFLGGDFVSYLRCIRIKRQQWKYISFGCTCAAHLLFFFFYFFSYRILLNCPQRRIAASACCCFWGITGILEFFTCMTTWERERDRHGPVAE